MSAAGAAPDTVAVPRPRLKLYPRRVEDGCITLFREPGVEFKLDDADGVAALLDELTGERSPDELAADLSKRFPQITTDDFIAAIAALDDAGLLEDADATTRLSAWEQERYFSNLAFFATFADLARSRFALQERLCDSRVVLLGVGGLGSSLLYNLAGMGVGHVTALDCDRVELKNFARQFLYTEADIGLPKLERAVARAKAFNSAMEIAPVERRVRGPEDVVDLLDGVDLVLSAIDQPLPDVHRWVNEACVSARVPYVSGGMFVARGSYYSVDPGRSGCLVCCDRAGAERPPRALEQVNRGLGPVATVLGGFVSLEAARYLTGFAPPIAAGRVWFIDFATSRLELAFSFERDPNCPVCGQLEPAPPRPGADQLELVVG